MDLPGEQAQVDVAKRLRSAEALRQLAQLESRRFDLLHRYCRPQSLR